jgi:hypothetical protein
VLTSAAARLTTLLREGTEQEKAQLTSRIVSSGAVQSDALRIQISKGTLRAELLGAGEDSCESAITLRAPRRFSKRGQ